MPSRSPLFDPPQITNLPRIEDVVRRDFLSSALAVTLFIFRGDEGVKAAEGTRTITNEYGTYEAPTDPKRLLLMGNRYDLETACALDLSPIAMGREYSFQGGSADYVAPWVTFDPSGVEMVFDLASPDVEALLRLNPDLIFAVEHWLEPDWIGYETLSAVAPVIPTSLLPWREDLQQVARWLGREDRLSATFQDYETLRTSIKGRHAERIQNANVVFGSFEAPNTIWLVDSEAADVPAMDAFAELGGHQLPLSLGGSVFTGWSSISLENLRLIEDADAMLIWAPDEFQRAELLANPLWSLLSTVRDGRAVVSTNNVGEGSIYTVMECLRLWDEVYALLE